MTPGERALDLLRQIVEDVAKWERDDNLSFSDLGERVLDWVEDGKDILAEVEAAAQARRS